MYITEITEESENFSISETKLIIVLICMFSDIGGSPRIQYHALSFAQNEWKVDFIGCEKLYGGRAHAHLTVAAAMHQ
ncbi:hypothetical protein Glove_213g102 [Diversispora epigaea]|uniref:Uncharacterized protein n=1 Tax=Diversispora epigaea TaxID=1348612 RepID=A0A397IL10_9GLOM|nr:hypothetical protein Glove_213g102 [Diversispora epigaea]